MRVKDKPLLPVSDWSFASGSTAQKGGSPGALSAGFVCTLRTVFARKGFPVSSLQKKWLLGAEIRSFYCTEQLAL